MTLNTHCRCKISDCQIRFDGLSGLQLNLFQRIPVCSDAGRLVSAPKSPDSGTGFVKHFEVSVDHNQMKTRPALSDVSANAEFARQARTSRSASRSHTVTSSQPPKRLQNWNTPELTRQAVPGITNVRAITKFKSVGAINSEQFSQCLRVKLLSSMRKDNVQVSHCLPDIDNGKNRQSAKSNKISLRLTLSSLSCCYEACQPARHSTL